EVRALLRGDQHRDVLAGRGRRDDLVIGPEGVEAVATGRATVRIGVNHELPRGVERGVAGRVHVPDDHVRLPALLEDRVRAAVDGHYRRALVTDVRPQHLEVALVVDTADDNERRAIAEVRREVGEIDVTRQELPLLPDVRDRVLGEERKRLADPAPALLVLAADGRGVLDLAAPEHLAVADELAIAERDPPAV